MDLHAPLALATPVEIDTELARIWGESDRAHYTLTDVTRQIRRFEQSLYATEVPQDLIAQRDKLRERIGMLQDEAQPLKDEYNRRPWARYYRVDNTNGHVHTNTSCRTTYDTTVFGWLPQVSGATAEEIVEQAGALTCLVCFPGVREEILAGRPCRLETDNQRKTREEREARDAEKAVKAAAKAAKAIANPDGSPLRLKDGFGAINTLRTAEMEYVNEAAQLRMYQLRVDDIANRRIGGGDPGHPDYVAKTNELYKLRSDNVAILLAALAHKLGTTIEEQRERLAKKVNARYIRDWR